MSVPPGAHLPGCLLNSHSGKTLVWVVGLAVFQSPMSWCQGNSDEGSFSDSNGSPDSGLLAPAFTFIALHAFLSRQARVPLFPPYLSCHCLFSQPGGKPPPPCMLLCPLVGRAPPSSTPTGRVWGRVQHVCDLVASAQGLDWG